MQGGFSNPEKVMGELKIPAGSRVADFGSGSGYFTLLIAKAVGPTGTVTAVDVLPSMLEVVRTKARDEGLFNIHLVRANLDVIGGSNLEDESQNFVFLANILFQTKEKEGIIEETKRVLKTGGSVIVIDWVPSAAFGPKEVGWKISQEEARKIFEEKGFTFVRNLPVSSNHWGFVVKK